MSVLLLSNCRVAVKNVFKAVMVNNSTNINKINNQLLLNTKYTMIYDVRNPGLDLGQTQRSGGVKQINQITTALLLIVGSPTINQIYSYNKKPTKIRLQSERPSTITNLNDNINMDSTIAVSVNA